MALFGGKSERKIEFGLVFAPQLLGRIKRGVERRRLLYALGVRVILFWFSPGTFKDFVGRHQSNALVFTLN